MKKIALNGEIFDLYGPAGPDGNPIGTVISFMGLKAPKDYLICDGSSYKISDYPNLASFFKDQFGSETYFGSNGAGTFAVPDMRNLFLRGYHGTADESLSGSVGKRQEATEHIWMVGGSSWFAAMPTIAVRSKNHDTSITGSGDKIRAIMNTVGFEGEYGGHADTFTSRPVNMAVLYCIKAVDSQTVYETFEEYDTTVDGCDWHVRKWSNGYCELYGLKEYTVSSSDFFAYGTSYQAQLAGPKFPFSLTKKYAEQVYFTYIAGGVNAWIGGYDDTVNVTLDHVHKFSLMRPLSFEGTNKKMLIFFSVTGRWKEETAEAIERVTSEVLPKKSGTITKEGKQYDYELPQDIVSAASSAATSLSKIER